MVTLIIESRAKETHQIMANMSFGQRTTNSFYFFALSLYVLMRLIEAFEEHVIRQEVKVLTQRKMFALAGLDKQLTYQMIMSTRIWYDKS